MPPELDPRLREELAQLMRKLGLGPHAAFDDVLARLREQSGELSDLETSLLFLDEWRGQYLKSEIALAVAPAAVRAPVRLYARGLQIIGQHKARGDKQSRQQSELVAQGDSAAAHHGPEQHGNQPEQQARTLDNGVLCAEHPILPVQPDTQAAGNEQQQPEQSTRHCRAQPAHQGIMVL